jgi:hypothetical protein
LWEAVAVAVGLITPVVEVLVDLELGHLHLFLPELPIRLL